MAPVTLGCKGTQLTHSTLQHSTSHASTSARSTHRPRPSALSTLRSSSPPAAGPEAAAGCPVNREGLGLNEIRLIHRGPGGSGPGKRPTAVILTVKKWELQPSLFCERLLLSTRNMDRLLRLGGGMPGLGQGPPTDAPAVDTAEQVYISSLALLKMLKHGRAGVPMEVMGLMLGEFVDDYTVRVIDVFAMPQSGTGVSVEAVDPVFQAKMLDMLKQTGRPEMVVGWYHSHPGFGCWLSGVDINTQQSFEALSERAVAVVVDPIQSVKGKVVIDAFRLINANMMVLGHEPRQTTSNLGHLNKPSIQALIHGLNRHYYSITINYRKNELEQKMLLNLHKKSWMEGLTLQDYSEHCKLNETVVKEMLELAKNYNKAVEEEDKMTPEQLAIKNVGKQDPKRHLEEHVDVLMTSNIVQCLAAMLDTVVFK
ncbi:26S proteasome non-ATPase regulatory subunit 14 isoform X1 [Zonotrichia albicollis]|uniref:26S proteasome non-ATPase regulatory subunit 14 isoform X1 n=1 Tax=Zonotrichia albicollis TaxID=44394 RepID=UPI003D80C62B